MFTGDGIESGENLDDSCEMRNEKIPKGRLI